MLFLGSLFPAHAAYGYLPVLLFFVFDQNCEEYKWYSLFVVGRISFDILTWHFPATKANSVDFMIIILFSFKLK